MGCASSKHARSRCRHCKAPYSPVTTRSYSMHVHHPPETKGDSYHVVALTSTTLGTMKLDTPLNQNGHVNEDHNHPIIEQKKEFEMGMIEAKAWSKMIDEKITKVVPRTPIRTPPGEPETINAWELMEGLEDTSPLRPANHLRSFSFHVSNDSLPTIVDSPKKDGNGELISKSTIVSDFDPEVISAFRKALEALPPTNPFRLKPPDCDHAKEFAEEKIANDIDPTQVTDEKKMVHVYANENGFVEKEVKDKKMNGIAEEKEGYENENGFENHGKKKVILFFTSLRGVRKTYEDCCNVRLILKGLGVKVDERDVSMHSVFKDELKELLGDGFNGMLPKVFVGERYIGGAHEIRQMHEDGQLEKVLEGCELLEESGDLSLCKACGDIRFMPCETCSGSCKIYYEVEEDDEEYDEEEYGFQRCPDCNENGLVRCPLCCS